MTSQSIASGTAPAHGTATASPLVSAADLFAAEGRSLFGTALRLTRRAEDAEDIVQEALLAYHRRQFGLPREEAGRWLHRVVVNRSLDRLRSARRWRWVEWPAGDEDPTGASGAVVEALEAPPERPIERLDLERAVERLPEASRLVFLLHDVEGLRHREIAERLGIHEGTSKSQLHRARAAVRRHLAGAGAQPAPAGPREGAGR